MNAMKQGHLKIAESPTILDAALGYLELGWSVLPVRGKEPAIAWATFQTKRPAYSYIHNWHRDGLLQGVGIICGKVSSNLAVIDLDGQDAVKEFESCFNFNTYSVLSGSGKGKHIYLYVDNLPVTTRTKGFELRANGCYVVAPPSVHPSGQRYTVAAACDIQCVSNLDDVVAFIRNKIPALQPPRVATPPNVAAKSEWEAKAREFYLNAAIEGEASRIRQAAKGERNNTLFHASKRLARLLQNGGDSEQVRSALLAAAQFVGTPRIEAERTIESGIRHGLQASARAYPDAKTPQKG